MAIRTILVCLNSVENAPDLLSAAAVIARRENAHVIGLHSLEALVVYPGVAMHIPVETFEDFSISQRKIAAEIEKIFKDQTRNEDFASEWRLVKADTTTAVDRMIESARAADLVIMSQEEASSERYDHREEQANVIKRSGRPVLIIPKGYKTIEIGQNALVGWSGTREATRAAHDLIALAKADSNVNILRVGGDPVDEMSDFTANDLAATYAHHGMQAKVIHRGKLRGSIAKVLMNEAFETGADVIVTGAFGHSRTYDFVLGAVTQELLRSSSLPVLFSK